MQRKLSKELNDMERYTEVCGDNRFELIEKYKEKLVKATNIETSKEEMDVIDNILFRFWQMGWLDKLEENVVPRSEYEELKAKLEKQYFWEKLLKAESHAPIIAKAKQEVAREIFEEIDDIAVMCYHDMLLTEEQAIDKILELRKKHIGE
jgi:hypothetical protein